MIWQSIASYIYLIFSEGIERLRSQRLPSAISPVPKFNESKMKAKLIPTAIPISSTTSRFTIPTAIPISSTTSRSSIPTAIPLSSTTSRGFLPTASLPTVGPTVIPLQQNQNTLPGSSYIPNYSQQWRQHGRICIKEKCNGYHSLCADCGLINV